MRFDELPKVWLGLLPPSEPDEAERLVSTALATGRPIDISSAPALWGGHMRGTGAVLTSFGGRDVENATDPAHAVTLIHAELIQILSGIGREYLDVYFLTVRKKLAEHQIEGALTALRSAKCDGLVKSCGLFIEGARADTVQELMREGVFDLVMSPDNPLQQESRSAAEQTATEHDIPLASCRTINWGDGVPFTDDIKLAQYVVAQKAQRGIVLVGVRSVEEIGQAVAAESIEPPEDLSQQLEEIAARFKNARRKLAHA